MVASSPRTPLACGVSCATSSVTHFSSSTLVGWASLRIRSVAAAQRTCRTRRRLRTQPPRCLAPERHCGTVTQSGVSGQRATDLIALGEDARLAPGLALGPPAPAQTTRRERRRTGRDTAPPCRVGARRPASKSSVESESRRAIDGGGLRSVSALSARLRTRARAAAPAQRARTAVATLLTRSLRHAQRLLETYRARREGEKRAGLGAR